MNTIYHNIGIHFWFMGGGQDSLISTSDGWISIRGCNRLWTNNYSHLTGGIIHGGGGGGGGGVGQPNQYVWKDSTQTAGLIM